MFFSQNVTIISKKDSNVWKYAIKNNLNHLESTIDLENLFKSNYKNNLENLVIKDIKYNNIDHSSLLKHKIKDLDNLIIPNNVVNVLNNSLSFTNITTLNTNDVIELCDNSISDCNLLKYVFIPNANIIGDNTFKNSINLNTIFISSDYINISSSSFNETKLNLNIYILGDATIDDGAIPKFSTVWCKENSNVHNYVLKNNIKHVLI